MRLAVDVIEEVDQQLGVAAARAEMDVGDPDRRGSAAARSTALLRIDGFRCRKIREIGDIRTESTIW